MLTSTCNGRRVLLEVVGSLSCRKTLWLPSPGNRYDSKECAWWSGYLVGASLFPGGESSPAFSSSGSTDNFLQDLKNKKKILKLISEAFN